MEFEEIVERFHRKIHSKKSRGLNLRTARQVAKECGIDWQDVYYNHLGELLVNGEKYIGFTDQFDGMDEVIVLINFCRKQAGLDPIKNCFN